MRIDIVTDIETLGIGENPPVFQIAAVAKDLENWNELYSFNESCSLDNFTNIEGGTLNWWLNTNSDLLKEITNNSIHNKEIDLINSFGDWLDNLINNFGQKNVYFWGNGILFDNRIIKTKLNSYDRDYPIFYQNDRDLRTIYEIVAVLKGYNSTKDYKNSINIADRTEHDALNDVRYELAILQDCYNTIKDLNGITTIF